VFGEEIKKFDLQHVIPNNNYRFLEVLYKLFLENKLLIKPYEDDYIRVKNEFNGKRVICINGRNAIQKHTARNNIMVGLIGELINAGYFVINTTIMPPHLNYNPESYIEISENHSYNETLSYYTNSDCVVSIQNGSGISTHLLSEANFIILQNTDTSITNLIKIRQEKGMKTEILAEGNVLNSIRNYSPPIIERFSDRNKIVCL
jgi:hypothetical protein